MILAGDVGGTKVGLALYADRATGLERVKEATYPSGDYASLEEIIRDFLGDEERKRIDAACIGVAGPVLQGVVRLTNLGWDVDQSGLARALQFPVKLLNDLEATAFGMLFLEPESFAQIQEGDPPGRRGNIAVIAAGTGLGQAMLYWDGRQHQPVATEGGHGSFAPRSEREVELLRYLQRKFGRHVSVERVVSGMGMSDVYDFLREHSGQPEPEWLRQRIAEGDPSAVVSRAGLAGEDPVCVDAVELFVSNYGSEAGNMALRCMALGGVLVGGGIAPKMLRAFQEGTFLDAFLDKGRFRSLLESMRVAIALDPETALYGAAQYAWRMARG